MKGKSITVIFVVMLLLGASFVLVFPPDFKSFVSEKRLANTMPELTIEAFRDGTFKNGFDGYLNDRVAFRGGLTTASAFIRDIKGIEGDYGKVISLKQQDWYGNPFETYLIYHDDRIMEVFEKKENVQKMYISALNSYADKLGKDVNLYSMIVPTQLEFDAEIYSNFQDSQRTSIDEINTELNPDYRCVDVYGALKQHSDDYIYFKTDHHWTSDGAYEAYVEFCKTAGLKPVEKDDYTLTEYKGILGSLYDISKEEILKKHTDVIKWYDTDPENEMEIVSIALRDGKTDTYKTELFDKDISKMQYSAFAGGDNPLTIAKNNSCENKKTLLILKDSYANAFFPWVVKNYSTVIMVDPRSYSGNLSDITAEYKIDDFLVLNYIFTTAFEAHCETLQVFSE